jgi:hypothetical protein
MTDYWKMWTTPTTTATARRLQTKAIWAILEASATQYKTLARSFLLDNTQATTAFSRN